MSCHRVEVVQGRPKDMSDSCLRGGRREIDPARGQKGLEEGCGIGERCRRRGAGNLIVGSRSWRRVDDVNGNRVVFGTSRAAPSRGDRHGSNVAWWNWAREESSVDEQQGSSFLGSCNNKYPAAWSRQYRGLCLGASGRFCFAKLASRLVGAAAADGEEIDGCSREKQKQYDQTANTTQSSPGEIGSGWPRNAGLIRQQQLRHS